MKAKPPVPTKNPVLYILMRNDMNSLNPGKMVAQGAHAANQFSAWCERHAEDPMWADAHAMSLEWKEQAEDFGTTICLGVNGQTLTSAIAFLIGAGFPAGITHDPSYPFQDGETLHLLPLNTCGWVFGDKDELRPLLSNWGLMQ